MVKRKKQKAKKKSLFPVYRVPKRGGNIMFMDLQGRDYIVPPSREFWFDKMKKVTIHVLYFSTSGKDAVPKDKIIGSCFYQVRKRDESLLPARRKMSISNFLKLVTLKEV